MVSFDTDRFIIEVEQRPAIWDPRCPEYSNKLQRGNAWKELCDIFVAEFQEMDSVRKNKAAVDLQRRWKSLRDSFRRELAKLKKEKSTSAAETGRKEYVYFRKLSFLLPICESKPPEEGSSEGPVEEKNSDDKNHLPPRPPITQQKKKRKEPPTEEQLLLQTLTKSIERRSREKEFDDPDRHFLLGLLPHFKSLPEDAKLEVQGEFINTLKRYKQHVEYASRHIPQASTPLFSGLASFMNQAPNTFPLPYNAGLPSSKSQQTLIPDINHSFTNSQPSESTGSVFLSQLQQTRMESPSPESAAASRARSPMSDSSSICDDLFSQ